MRHFLQTFFVYISNLISQQKNLYSPFVYVLLIIFTLFVWLPTRYLPHHWDAAGFVINAAKDILDSNFTHYTSTHSDFAHPPLLMVVLAAAWRLFTDSLITSHLVMLPFVIIYPLATFSLAKKFIPLLPASLTAFTLVFIPYYLAEAGIVYVDLPTAALAVLAFVLLYHRLVLLSILVFTLSVLTKETTLLLFPAFLYLSYTKKLLFDKVYLFILPLLSLAAWFYYHFTVTGFWLFNASFNGAARFSLEAGSISRAGQVIVKMLFWEQLRSLLFIPAAASLIFLQSKSKLKFSSQDKLLLLATIIPLSFFIVVGEFAERYSLFFIPFLTILAYRVIYRSLQQLYPHKANLYIGIIGLIVSLAFISRWYPPTPTMTEYEFTVSSDLRYQDMIMVFRQLSAYAQIEADETSVFYGAFPENIYLTQPYQGYVAQSVPFLSCGEFSPEPNLTQYIIFHPFSPSQIVCRQLIDRYPLDPLNRFESNGKWIEIYVASDSAPLD